MKKRDQGVLAVEASIALTFFALFTLFLFSFIRVYSAQNMVSHATLQTADAMALESYLRETALDDQLEDVFYLSSRLTGSVTLSEDSFESLRSANIPSIAREKFISAISNSESNADTILKNLGVKDGIYGIDFSMSKMDLDHDDVIVSVSYSIKLQFPIFGATELQVTKSAKAKTFGEILFEIIVEPEFDYMGSTTGTGSYQHGQVIQISATPAYGYKFVQWDDGDTSNPRTVTVTDAHKYVAIFEADSFGITVNVTPEGAGSATGGNTYPYLDTAHISATANPGYHFEKWSIYKHKDNLTAFSSSNDIEQIVDQSYTFTANFVPNTYTIKVVSSGASGVINAKSGSQTGETITLQYGATFELIQTAPVGYTFKGWKIEGGTDYIFPTNNISVPSHYPSGEVIPDGATIVYTAYYEKSQYSISVTSAGNGTVSGGGTYTHGSNATIIATPSSGYEFDYWEKDGVKVGIGSTYAFTVTNSTSFIAHFREKVNPSIAIESGEVGHHTVKLKAITIPADAPVSWLSSNQALKITVDPYDSHIVTVEINDSKINGMSLSREETHNNSIKYGVPGNVETRTMYDYIETVVTAKINVDGIEKTSSKRIRSRESVDVGYVEYWGAITKNEKYGFEKNPYSETRYYYDIRQTNEEAKSDWGILKYERGCYDRTWSYTYSKWRDTNTISMLPNTWSKDNFKKGIAPHNGLSGQHGINKSNLTGYIIKCAPFKKADGGYVKGYNTMVFQRGIHGDKIPGTSDYYDYYISSIN